MRARILFFCLLVGAACLLLLLHRRSERKPAGLPPGSVLATNNASDGQALNEVASARSQPTRTPAASSALAPPAIPPVTEDANSYSQRLLAEWQAPIEFYGKVVDENGNAVPGATAQFGWTETPMEVLEESHGKKSTKSSDANGFFELHGARGPSLEVQVGKPGYYSSKQDPWSFKYAISGQFSPDPANPIVFHLRKKRQGATLVTSENGIRQSVALRTPKDGTPITLDPFQKVASPSGQIRISQNKPPWREATEWSLAISIPDGGLVENADEFPFTAPDTNYQAAVEYHFTKGQSNWISHVTKQFYITLGQPRSYGWLRIESDLAQETVFITYAINPSGSRNLEPSN